MVLLGLIVPLPESFRLFRLRLRVVAELGIPFPERLHEVFALRRG